MPQLMQDDLDQARSLEGSVYDDWWSWLRRLGADDPTGGLDPSGGMNVGAGIVRGANHPAFRLLQQTGRREAKHLQKSPAIVRFANTSAKELRDQGVNAVTIPIGAPAGTPQADWVQRMIQSGGLRDINIPVSELQEMARTPGSSVQLYPRTGPSINPRTPLHEAGHSLRLARTGGETAMPSISPAKARTVLEQAQIEGFSPPSDYRGDEIHRALDAISRLRMGGFWVE